MKKIKLLTGLSALSVLGLSSLPLTGCSKFDGRVTEDEWKKAIGYLCGYTQEEGKEGQYEGISDWVMDPKGSYLNVKILDKGEKLEGVAYEYIVGPFGYTYSKLTGETPLFKIETNVVYTILYEFFSTIYNYYKDFEFQNDNYYHFSGQLQQYLTLDTKIGFNQNRKMSHLETKVVSTKASKTTTMDIKVDFDYSKKNIEWPKELTDRVATHCRDLSSSLDIDTTIFKNVDDGLILHINPDQDGYNKLAAFGSSPSATTMFGVFPNVYKNGVELVKNTDYEIKDAVIIFTKELSTTDHVYVQFDPLSTDATYTFKIYK